MPYEATIRPRSGGASILNAAMATFKEAPLPVKLVIGGTIGTVVVTGLTSCLTQYPPCEISPENLDPNSAARPITIVSCNPKKEVSTEDQTKLKQKYGADLQGLYLWAAVDKGSGTENTGDGTIAFSTYSFANNRSMVVFPTGKEDYNGENNIYEYTVSWFETADGKILYSYNYQDELNPGKVTSFFTVEFNKPEGVTLSDLTANGADPSKSLGIPTRIIVSNPPANEEITYNVDSNNPDDKKLIESIADMFSVVGVVHALGEGTAMPPPTEAPTDIPTPMPVEVAPGEFIPASQITGYEARDTSGKLIYVEDINGKWIKVTHEVTVAPATQEDWANVNTRLGTDFVINTDGTITGVEGLNINMANGEATFNFDSKGSETYHIANIKVQEINGVKTLLVAGYAWNQESKSWEVFNPGFQKEDPSQAGWFIDADVPNGNWLRFRQRDIEKNGTGDLTTAGIRPDKWDPDTEFIGSRKGINGSVLHYDYLRWENSQVEDVNGNKQNIEKNQYPGRGGLCYGYMVDTGFAIASFDALNGDGSVTSMPMIIDDIMWSEHKNTVEFTRLVLANGLEWDESMVKEITFKASNHPDAWLLWPIVSIYPDSTIPPSFFGEKTIQLLTGDAEGNDRRAATVQGDKITSSASLELWPARTFFDYRE